MKNIINELNERGLKITLEEKKQKESGSSIVLGCGWDPSFLEFEPNKEELVDIIYSYKNYIVRFIDVVCSHIDKGAIFNIISDDYLTLSVTISYITHYYLVDLNSLDSWLK